ncbi:MAG: DMT family transporter [Alphaproteobacteria bacterium]|nr:DMT family transporter [Alphaproteobacteria bacterium]
MSVRGGVRSSPNASLGSWVVGLLAVAIWGATPAATKYAVAGIDPFAVGMLRTALAGLAVIPAVWLLNLPLPRDQAGWRLLLISTASGFIGFPLLFSLALAHTSTAHAALVLAFAPILTGLIGATVERRRPGRSWWGGVVVALAGVAALILLRGRDSGEATLYGDLLALGACLAVAGGYVAGSRLSSSIGAWSVTAWGAILGSVVLLPVLAILFMAGGWPDAGWVSWTATAWLALFSSLLAYVAWYWALAAGGVARISTLQFLQPAVTLAIAVAVFAEPMTPGLLMSAAAILVGVAMARRG